MEMNNFYCCKESDTLQEKVWLPETLHILEAMSDEILTWFRIVALNFILLATEWCFFQAEIWVQNTQIKFMQWKKQKALISQWCSQFARLRNHDIGAWDPIFMGSIKFQDTRHLYLEYEFESCMELSLKC